MALWQILRRIIKHSIPAAETNYYTIYYQTLINFNTHIYIYLLVLQVLLYKQPTVRKKNKITLYVKHN
jgi:hypothetical protein